MKLIEADAKNILRNRGVPVPAGRLLAKDDIDDRLTGAVVKAQIFTGGRGKAGLVQVGDPGQVVATIGSVRARMIAAGHEPLVMVEEKVAFDQEIYLAWRIDDVSQRGELLFSMHGGVNVEDNPGSIRTLSVDPLSRVAAQTFVTFFRDAGVRGKLLGPLCRMASQLHAAFVAEDAELLEINPVAVTREGKLVALDAKMVVDDEAEARHGNWTALESRRLALAERRPFEALAAERGVTFVELEGEIACFSGGAGLGMLVMDALVDAGFRPANFVDTISGSGSKEFALLGETVFEYARQDHVRAILAYFTLTATSLKGLVTGLLDLLERVPPPKPFFLGIHAAGPAVAELSLADAQSLLRTKGYECSVELLEVTARLKEGLRQ
jgi:succinyl-CoA synthetase beta subunit